MRAVQTVCNTGASTIRAIRNACNGLRTVSKATNTTQSQRSRGVSRPASYTIEDAAAPAGRQI